MVRSNRPDCLGLIGDLLRRQERDTELGINIRIAERMSPDPTEEELDYFRRMGIEAALAYGPPRIGRR